MTGRFGMTDNTTVYAEFSCHAEPDCHAEFISASAKYNRNNEKWIRLYIK